MVNAPWVFPILFQMVKRFLDAGSIAKIVVPKAGIPCSSHWQRQVWIFGTELSRQLSSTKLETAGISLQADLLNEFRTEI